MNDDRIDAARQAGWEYFKAHPEASLAAAWWEAQRQGWELGEQRLFVQSVQKARAERDERGRE